MDSITCPNDGTPMESDASFISRVHACKDVTHTCPECGYSETR
ncbi:hypothetical protein [Streptomyces sp. MMS24-I29]